MEGEILNSGGRLQQSKLDSKNVQKILLIKNMAGGS